MISQRHRSPRGQVLVLVLVFVTLFGVFAASLLTLAGSSLTSARSAGDARAEQYAADGAVEATLAALQADRADPISARKGAEGGSSCGLSVPASTGSPATTVDCTPLPGSGLGTSATTNSPPFAILALGDRLKDAGPYSGTNPSDPGRAEPGIRVQESPGGSNATSLVVRGDVRVNSGVSLTDTSGDTSTAKSMTVRGDVLVNQECVGTITEASPGSMSPQCSNVFPPAVAPTSASDPGYNNDAVSTVEQPIPTCSTNPNNKLVTFTPGRYSNAVALNELFTTCTDHDFWFKPGSYLFNFTNAAAGSNNCPLRLPSGVTENSANTAHRMCIGARQGSDTTSTTRVVAGTPEGWDPRESSETPASLRGTASALTGTWSQPTQGAVLDDLVASSSWSNTSVARNSTSITGSSWSNLSQGAVIDQSQVATTSWAAPSPVVVNGTAVSAGSWSNPNNALLVEGTASPAAASTTLTGTNTALTSLRVSGFSASGAPASTPVTSATLRVRHSATRLSSLSSPSLTITTGTGRTCSTYTIGRPGDNAYFTSTVEVQSGCLNTLAEVQGASVNYVISKCQGCANVTINIDGIDLQASYAAAETRTATISSFTPTVASVPTKVTVEVAHSGPATSSSRIRIQGSTTCGPYTLPQHTSLATDVVDVTSCLDTVAKINGAQVVFETARPTSSGTVTLDGVRLVTSAAAVDPSLEVKSFSALPSNVDSLVNTKLRVRYASSTGTLPRLIVTPTSGAACAPYALAQSATFTTIDVDVTSCLATPSQVSGAKVAFLVQGNPGGASTTSLDGVELVATYKLLPDRVPALGLGCGDARPGVQWVFAGDSRVEMVSGSLTMCPGPGDSTNPQRISIYQVPATRASSPDLTPAFGCTTTTTMPRNYWDGLSSPDCAVFRYGTRGTERAQVHIKGTIYAPSGVVDAMDAALSMTAFDRGIVVRHLRVRGAGSASGYTGPMIRNSGYVRPTTAPRTVDLLARSSGRDVLSVRARVEEDYSLTIISWRLTR